MSLQERFQQAPLRMRGRALARSVSDEVSRRSTEPEGRVTPDAVRDAYNAVGMDKYDKVALLAYLVEDGCARYGTIEELDALSCRLIGRRV